MENLNLKKFFLYLLIASVSVSALLGIFVILFGDFGEIEVKILMTTVTITCTSILGLACGANFETGRSKPLPIAGIVFAVISAILWIVLIWGNVSNEEFIFKSVASSTLLAVSCSHLSLLLLAKLDRRFIWSRLLVFSCVGILSAILLYIIWLEPESDSDFVSRLIGVLSIIIAALTVTTPVFHKLSRNEPEEKQIDEEIAELKTRLAELEKRKAEIQDNSNERRN